MGSCSSPRRSTTRSPSVVTVIPQVASQSVQLWWWVATINGSVPRASYASSRWCTLHRHGYRAGRLSLLAEYRPLARRYRGARRRVENEALLDRRRGRGEVQRVVAEIG